MQNGLKNSALLFIELRAIMNTASEIKEYELLTRAQVIKRDKGRCLSCKKKAHDVHEIIPRSRFGKLNMGECFKPDNRCCLCRECHGKAHTIKMRQVLTAKIQQISSG